MNKIKHYSSREVEQFFVVTYDANNFNFQRTEQIKIQKKKFQLLRLRGREGSRTIYFLNVLVG